MDDNPARPPPGIRLCEAAEIADPGAKGFRFRYGEAVFAGFVVRRDGAVRGFVDSCPHAGWPLAMSDHRYLTRNAEHILCTGHGALFRPEDGLCVAGPCAGRSLDPWPVALRGNAVVTA